MAPPLLLLQDVAFGLGGAKLLDGAELAVAAGDRIGLVGRNGSGKSTLLRIAAGALAADSGRRFVQPGAAIRYLPQEPDLAGHATTLDYAADGEPPHRARALLAALGLTGEEAPATLSGGEARRAALARALAPAPDILLLDEPTNHLDLPAIEWLQAELAGLRCGLVLISHDRRLLEQVTGATVWIDGGRTRRMERGFAHFDAWRDETLAQEAAARHKLGRKIAAEEDWLRYGVTARRKRNQRRLGELHALRDERRRLRAGLGTAKLEAAAGETSGKLVIDVEGVAKAFGERRIVCDLTLKVMRGDRLGIVGRNGAGKTTLLRLLTGALAPDSGGVRLGPSVRVAELDQRRAVLDPARTLAATLTDGHGDMVTVGEAKRHVIGYMKDFLFAPEQARTPVGELSGGERGRLALARALATPANLIVLDEPTNDLDLETLELLQEVLAEHPATVLLVSHDRDFLDRVATSTLAAEGDGRWIEYAGGYSDMLAQRGTPDVAPPAARAGRAAVRESRGSARLSYNDQRALETLPGRIAALTAEIARYGKVLADADLYRRDPAGFEQAGASLAAAETALSEAEDQWLELEMRRETLTGA